MKTSKEITSVISPRAPTRVGVVVIILIIAVGACNGDAEPGKSTPKGFSEGRVHPTPENVPDKDSLSSLIGIAENEKLKGTEIHELALRIAGADTVTSFGKLEGSRRVMIGKVGGVEGKYATNGMYLLDTRYNEIRKYDLENGFVRSFGSPGRGAEGTYVSYWNGPRLQWKICSA